MPDQAMIPHTSVVVVEDDPDDLFLILRALSRLGREHEVHAVHDGVELFDFLDRCPLNSMPELVILDLNLPRMDGNEALRRLRTDGRYRQLPVAVLSTSVASEDRRQVEPGAAISYLTKPESITELVRMLGTMFDELAGSRSEAGSQA